MTVGACADVPPQTGTVTFNQTEFLAAYSQFTLQAAFLGTAFVLATTMLSNCCSSVVCDANLRQTLLYLLTAHITKLMAGEGSIPATGLVGRISDATEGSVSLTAEYLAPNGGPSQAYFIQTQYGATWWQATAGFRTMRYVAPPPRHYGPWGWPN
jgi:hypothetical protein